MFFLLLLLPTAAHCLTLSQLLTEERVRIKDTSTSRQRYNDTQLTNLNNEAQRDVVNNTWCLQILYTFNTTVGTTYYTFPSNYITAARVTSNLLNVPETSLIQLDSLNQNASWENQSGQLPQYYFIDQSQPSNVDFGIYPYPQDASSTTTIKMRYYAYATDLASVSDIPFNGEVYLYPYHDLLVFYVAYRVYLIEGEIDKANLYRQEYEARLKVMEDKEGQRPNFIPGFSGPAHSR